MGELTLPYLTLQTLTRVVGPSEETLPCSSLGDSGSAPFLPPQLPILLSLKIIQSPHSPNPHSPSMPSDGRVPNCSCKASPTLESFPWGYSVSSHLSEPPTPL